MRVVYFRRTGLLMDYINYDVDSDMTPQGVIAKIVIPDSYTNTNTDFNIDSISPSEPFTPKTEHNNDQNDDDAHRDRVGDNENA